MLLAVGKEGIIRRLSALSQSAFISYLTHPYKRAVLRRHPKEEEKIADEMVVLAFCQNEDAINQYKFAFRFHICFIIPNKMRNVKRGKNANRDFG